MRLELQLRKPEALCAGAFPKLTVFYRSKRFPGGDVAYLSFQRLWCLVVGHRWGKWEDTKYTGGRSRCCTRCWDKWESSTPHNVQDEATFNGFDNCTDYEDEPREPPEFGCCLQDGECCMPGLHFPSECHTAADYERQHGTDWRMTPNDLAKGRSRAASSERSERP